MTYREQVESLKEFLLNTLQVKGEPRGPEEWAAIKNLVYDCLDMLAFLSIQEGMRMQHEEVMEVLDGKIASLSPGSEEGGTNWGGN